MTGSGQLVEVQATAEGLPYSVEDLARLIEVARPAIQKLIGIQQSILKIELPPVLP
jgi:ribonuclease PH